MIWWAWCTTEPDIENVKKTIDCSYILEFGPKFEFGLSLVPTLFYQVATPQIENLLKKGNI